MAKQNESLETVKVTLLEDDPYAEDVAKIAKTCQKGDRIVLQYKLRKDENGRPIESMKYDVSLNVYTEQAFETYVEPNKKGDSFLNRMGFYFQVLKKI